MILLYQKKVSAKQMIINEIKFMINNTPANDPEHITLINELKTLNSRALNKTATNLITAEEKIGNGVVSIAW